MKTNIIDERTELIADDGKYLTEKNDTESKGFYKRLLLGNGNNADNYIEVDEAVKATFEAEQDENI